MDLMLFLGGTAAGSDWRDKLIPLLDNAGIPYFNPIVEDWDDEAMEREIFVKSLPNTVELYVITQEMTGPYSIAEAVDSSNKKPEKTIFMYLSKGFDPDQIKSLEAVKKTVYENGAHVVSTFHEIIDVCKSMGAKNITCSQVGEKEKKFKSNVDKIFQELENKLRISNKNLTYGEIFDQIGVTDILNSVYISPSDLSSRYRDIIFKQIKIFLKKPLYENLSLEKKEDLRFIKESEYFKEFIENIFDKIIEKLVSRSFRVEQYLDKFDPKSEIKLKDIVLNTKVDKVSLLFILYDLKKKNRIYSFNGREVTLK